VEEWKNKVAKLLPLMFNNEKKVVASFTIAVYMNTMLNKSKNENDLRIFAEVLEMCREFATQNKLNGLLKTCLQWNNEGVNKYYELTKSNQDLIKEIREEVSEIACAMIKMGIVDIEDSKSLILQQRKINVR